MQKSEPDLFACGTSVHMLSLRATIDKRSVQTNATPDTRRPSRAPRTANDQITDLSRTLAFSDEVVSDISPECVSYAKAKGRMRSLFRPGDLGLGVRLRQSQREGGGRHDCRGEAKRHIPCHLRQPRQEQWMPTHTSHKEKILHAVPSQDLGLPHELSPRYAKDSSLEFWQAKMVPPSKSLPWEEQTLQRLSSSTTMTLSAKRNTTGLTEREETMLPVEKSSQKAHLGQMWSSEQTAFLKQQSSHHHQSFSNWERRPTDTEAMSPPKDFLTELMRGAHPVHQRKGDGTTIVLDNTARFNKVLQSSYPQQPREWFEKDGTAHPLGRTYVKGQQRWMNMPQPARTPEDLQWEYQSVGSVQPLDHTPSHIEETAATETPNQDFFKTMHDWCNKWHIHVQPNNITTESILEDLNSLCINSRMFAIAATSLLAEAHAKKMLDGLQRYTSTSETTTQEGVPPSLTAKLCQLLEDPVERVRVPAAITLHCMGKENIKAEQVLLSALDSTHSPSEQWASVQCLALAGVSSQAVVASLLQHLLHQDVWGRERAANLLTRVSRKTPLVHAMLAEQLNCRGWQERLSACQVLPRLHGGINKDLCSKLVVLTWEDWSPEVRQAAAQALGLSGHGKLIHDEIQRRLMSESETVRLDALKKLHSLKLMTSHLLPPFLSCFKDDHVSIRIEAAAVAGLLRLKEKQVLQVLRELLQDPSWKVQAQTLRALGEIGVCDSELTAQLLWVVRFEKLAEVRAEACHTIAALGLKDEQVVKTLKDLCTVEEDPFVLRLLCTGIIHDCHVHVPERKNLGTRLLMGHMGIDKLSYSPSLKNKVPMMMATHEVSSTLRQLGCDTESEDDLLEQIRSEVKRLGTQQSIKQDLVCLERRDTTDYVIKRPQLLPSTRDYLTDKHRYDVFASTSQQGEEGRETDTKAPQGPRPVGEDLSVEQRPWSPDRKTIDAQLEAMRQHCSIGAKSITLCSVPCQVEPGN